MLTVDLMVQLRRQVHDLNPELVELTIDIRIDDCLSNSTRVDGAFTGWQATNTEAMVQRYDLQKILELKLLKVLKYRLVGDFVGWRQQFVDECLNEVGKWLCKKSGNKAAMQYAGFLALRDAEWNRDYRMTEEEGKEIEEKRRAAKRY
jgi:hypothetical protein